MKIRNDFVTNSSSSSYILSFQKSKNGEDTDLLYSLISAIADIENDEDTGIGYIIKDLDDLKGYYTGYLGLPPWFGPSPSDESEEYKKFKEGIEAGKIFLVKDIGYCDSILGQLVEELAKKSPRVEVICYD